MSPKPEHPEHIRETPALDKQDATQVVVAEEESDEDQEREGEGYGYHLVGQEPIVHDGEDEDDMSHLSMEEQVRALVNQAQSVQENLSPAVQSQISESVERQRQEENREKAQVWKEEKAREIELSEDKVETIKNIMSNFRLSPTTLPSWASQGTELDLSKKISELKK